MIPANWGPAVVALWRLQDPTPGWHCRRCVHACGCTKSRGAASCSCFGWTISWNRKQDLLVKDMKTSAAHVIGIGQG